MPLHPPDRTPMRKIMTAAGSGLVPSLESWKQQIIFTVCSNEVRERHFLEEYPSFSFGTGLLLLVQTSSNPGVEIPKKI